MGVGFALKWADPKAKVVPLLIAAEACDLLIIPLIPFKLSTETMMVLTHGLFMSVVWSLLAAGLACAFRQRARTAIVYGLAVFSHWILDFITHPMGAIFGDGGSPLPPDMPLLFGGSPLVGLGLYNHSYALAVGFDLGVTALGIAAYVIFKIREKRSTT